MDERGIPGCLVATSEFKDAAFAQLQSLGFDAEIVWVEHPIQNRTPLELEELAKEASDGIFRALVSSD